MSWKKVQDKLKGRNLDEEFEKFLNESLSDESTTVSPRGKGSKRDNAGPSSLIRTTEAEKPWWAKDEDMDDDPVIKGIVQKSWIKTKINAEDPIYEQSEDDKKDVEDATVDGGDQEPGHLRGPKLSIPPISMSKDSLDDGSRPSTRLQETPLPQHQEESTYKSDGSESGHLEDVSENSDAVITNEGYGTTTGPVTTDEHSHEPGLETLEEANDKKRFFENIEGFASGTIDYSELNKMLDAEGTLRNPNLMSLTDDRHFDENYQPEPTDALQQSDNDNSSSDDDKPSIKRRGGDESEDLSEDNDVDAEAATTTKHGLLDKVGLMESLDSTTGLRDALKRDRLKNLKSSKASRVFSPTNESTEGSSQEENTVRQGDKDSNDTVHGTSSTAREIAELQRALLEAKTLSSQNILRESPEKPTTTATNADNSDDRMIVLQKDDDGKEEQSLFHIKPTVSDVNVEKELNVTDSLPGFQGNRLSAANQWKGMADLDQLERSLERQLPTKVESGSALGLYQSNSSEMLLKRIMEDQDAIHGIEQKTHPVEEPKSEDEDSPPTDSLRSIKAIAEARKKSIRVRLDTAVSGTREKAVKGKGKQGRKKKQEEASDSRINKAAKRATPKPAPTPKRSTPKSKPSPAADVKKRSPNKTNINKTGKQGKTIVIQHRTKHASTVPRSAVSSISELAASVESFAGYLKTFSRADDYHVQSSPIRPVFQDDGPALSKSFSRNQANTYKLASVSRERTLQRELNIIRAELINEQKRNEQLEDELRVKERKWKMKEEKLQHEYDNDTRRLQQEIFVLKNKVKVAESAKEETTPDDPIDKDAEVLKLQEEIKEQEALLEGYHKENKRLYDDMKTKTEKAKAIETKMFDENQQLASQVALLKEKVSQLTVIPLRHSAELGSNKITQLENEIKFYRDRESQFNEEIKTLEAEKTHLQTRLRNLEKEKNAYRDKDKTASVPSRTEGQQANEIAKLQKKIKWFVENQEMVDADRAALRRKTEEVKDLRVLVERLQNSGPVSEDAESRTGKKEKQKTEDNKRIRDLERQVKEMESIIKKRYPNSVPAIIYAAASVPNQDAGINLQPERDTKTRLFLEKTIRRLEAELEEKDLDHSRALRGVEQKYTSMQTHYDDYIQTIERKLRDAEQRVDFANKNQNSDEHDDDVLRFQQNKIESLENEVRELVHRLEDERKKTSLINAEKNTKPTRQLRKNENLSNQKLTDIIGEKDAKIARLETALDEFMLRTASSKTTGNAIFQTGFLKTTTDKENLVNRSVSPIFPADSPGNKTALEKEIKRLNRELEKCKLEHQETKVKLNGVVAEREGQLREAFEKTDETLKNLIAKHDKEIERMKIEFAFDHSSSKVAELKSQLASQEIMLQHLKAKEIEATADRELLAASRVREESLRNQITALKFELSKAQRYHTPEMHHFHQLELKISQMEAKHNERELELQRVIDTTKLAASVEVEEIEEKWKDILQQKNLEIEVFKNELDSILQVLQELQRQGVVLSTKHSAFR